MKVPTPHVHLTDGIFCSIGECSNFLELEPDRAISTFLFFVVLLMGEKVEANPSARQPWNRSRNETMYANCN